ncbi:hypothetical protein RYX36_001666 [Vicia faba]
MASPVAIGTRGTIGSLVRKEIEYFTKFELDKRGTMQKPQHYLADMEMVSDKTISMSMSKPSFWFLPATWKRKKQRNTTSRFFRKICSVTEVNESNHFNRIPGYTYKILKNDFNNFQL